MSQLLTVFRAARLAGVSRSTIQKRIQDGDLPTFEGMVAADDLLQLYPNTVLEHNPEIERLENIKAKAFSRRVREKLMPSPEVMFERLNRLGQELSDTRHRLVHYQDLLDEVQRRLQKGEDADSLAHWLKSAIVYTPTETPGQQLMTQDTVLRIMEAHIKIRPKGHEFWQTGNDTLLEAGLRAGLSLNYGCANGNCGLCKARLVQGEIKKVRPHDYMLSDAEKSMNYFLLCSCAAISDVEIEALEADDEKDIPSQQINTKVKLIHKLSGKVTCLHVQTPRSQRLRFLAGQQLTLTLPNGVARKLSIASCPCDDRNLLFHIPHHEADAFSETLETQLRSGDPVELQGPEGDFLLNEDSKRSQVFIAYDSGFAPINSLIEHAMALDTAPSLRLYWYAEHADGLYALNLCRSWADALENFHYRSAVDEDPVSLLLNDVEDLSQCDVYLAGPAVHMKQAEYQLLQAGLPKEQLRMDNRD